MSYMAAPAVSRHDVHMADDVKPRRDWRTENRQKQALVGVRLRPEEMEQLRRDAERENVTAAELLRRGYFATA